MRNNIHLTTCVLLALSLVADAQTGAQGTPKVSLRGIKIVAVIIEDVNTPVRAAGTEPDTPALALVKAGVEEQLRSAGIRVTGPDDKKRRESVPALHLQLLAGKDERGFNYYTLRLWLTQEVILPRATPVRIIATTWDYSTMGFGAGYQLFEREICDRVHQFIEAYKEANSGKAAASQLMLFPRERYSGPCPLAKR